MKYPVILKLLIPLISAVILHFYTSFNVGIEILVGSLVCTGTVILPWFLKYKWSKISFNFFYPLFFFFLGGFIAEIHQSSNNDHYFTNFEKDWSNQYLVEVIEPPVSKENSIKCVVEVRKCNDQISCGKALIYFQKGDQSNLPAYGDLIFLETNFNAIKANGNPKEFDYARYLRIHNITQQAYVKTDQWVRVGNDANPVLSWIFDLRKSLNNTLQNSGMSPKECNGCQCLIAGTKRVSG